MSAFQDHQHHTHHHHHCNHHQHHICCRNNHHNIHHHHCQSHRCHHNHNNNNHIEIQTEMDSRQMEQPSPDIIAFEDDDDKATIISTENINRLSVIQLNSNQHRYNPPMISSSFIRKWISAVGVIDLLLFATSIVLSLITESYVCHDGPVVLRHFSEVFEYIPTEENSGLQLTKTPTVYEYVKERVFKDFRIDSPLLYHLSVIGLLAAATFYFVLEIWLFCVLLKIGKNPRISACIKWLSYRSIVLTILLLITFHDVTFTYQATCSELVMVPIYVVRSVIGGVPIMWIILNGITKW